MKRGAPDRGLVVVMDDDELVRWSAAEGLRESGYDVEVAANAQEVLEHCHGAAVVVLDHDSRRADTLDLADLLRGRCPACAIVLMAADPTPELLRGARERHVVRVLEKPFSLERLVEAIGSALAHSSDSPSSPPFEKEDAGDEPLETRASRGV
jgi:two-component system response regulator PrrA